MGIFLQAKTLTSVGDLVSGDLSVSSGHLDLLDGTDVLLHSCVPGSEGCKWPMQQIRPGTQSVEEKNKVRMNNLMQGEQRSWARNQEAWVLGLAVSSQMLGFGHGSVLCLGLSFPVYEMKRLE